MKHLSAQLFFILLIACSISVPAQDKDKRQIAVSGIQPESLKIAQSADHENVPGKLLNRKNFKYSSAKHYFRSSSKIKEQSERFGFEREIAELSNLKIGSNVFTTTSFIKLNDGSVRRPKLAVDGRMQTPPRIFQTDNFTTDESKNSRASYDLSSEISLLEQKMSGSKKNIKFRYAAPKTQDAAHFYEDSDPSDDSADKDNSTNKIDESFRWRSAIQQSLLFLGIQHGYAFTQPKTREALKGKFFRDYADSVKSLRGWADGGRFFTNYIAHPMQGSFTGFIYVQNDPKALKQQFSASKNYWQSRLKAMAWSAAWSTQFEIGPVSQASIGNVGLKGKQTYVDIVMTPLGGTALLVTEDAIDRFIMKSIERKTDNFYAVIFSRMLLSPTRTVANLFRFKTPWYRDRPRAK